MGEKSEVYNNIYRYTDNNNKIVLKFKSKQTIKWTERERKKKSILNIHILIRNTPNNNNKCPTTIQPDRRSARFTHKQKHAFYPIVSLSESSEAIMICVLGCCIEEDLVVAGRRQRSSGFVVRFRFWYCSFFFSFIFILICCVFFLSYFSSFFVVHSFELELVVAYQPPIQNCFS